MSVSGIGTTGPISTIGAAQAASAPAARAASAADSSPAAFFDMTSWTGAADASVTVGPAAAKASLPELSASVLSAILR